MSERYNYLTVALEKEIREDELPPLLAAIRQLRGVLDVQPQDDTNRSGWVYRQQAKHELTMKLYEALK